MRGKNSCLKYSGLWMLIIGIVLNIRMYLMEAWPTYLFYLISFIGIIQLILSLALKPIKIWRQIFWALIPFIIGLICLNIVS